MTRARIAELRIKLRLGQPIEDREVEALIDALERAELIVQLFDNGTGGELTPMINAELAKAGRL
jgi:hypothetical protein